MREEYSKCPKNLLFAGFMELSTLTTHIVPLQQNGQTQNLAINLLIAITKGKMNVIHFSLEKLNCWGNNFLIGLII